MPWHAFLAGRPFFSGNVHESRDGNPSHHLSDGVLVVSNWQCRSNGSARVSRFDFGAVLITVLRHGVQATGVQHQRRQPFPFLLVGTVLGNDAPQFTERFSSRRNAKRDGSTHVLPRRAVCIVVPLQVSDNKQKGQELGQNFMIIK